jgi:acyl-CoA dehydrogenase
MSETFRDETRAWLEANCPPEMRQPMRDESDACWGGRNPVFKNDAQKEWLEVMAARGWTVPDWPTEYGGGGLSPAESKILKQEMARIGARNPLMSFGISMLGPALLKYGTEAQKTHYLPQIARGEIRWCQGYSEPGAGSDLASLQTKCEDKGDHWLVNGQKVWTSMPTRRTGSSAWSAPIRRRPSTRGSASCCSTWRAPASRPGRSS